MEHPIEKRPVRPKGKPIASDDITRLRNHVRRVGEAAAIRGSGLSSPTFARALAGLSISTASGIAIRAMLDRVDAEKAAPTGQASQVA